MALSSIVSIALRRLVPPLAFAGVLVPEPAFAQDKPSRPEPFVDERQAATFDEIIVTARRIPERISDTPVAISVFTGSDIRERSAPNISLVDAAPNVSFDIGNPGIAASSASSIYIRGVGQDDFLPTTDPGVGVYLDGVYLGRTFGQTLPTIDVEQIEVLRGPQGTLYGRNSIGGAINVKLKKPAKALGGEAQLIVGTDRLLDMAVRSDIPLSEKILSAFTINYRRRDGFVSSPNAPQHEFGDDNKLLLRGQLRLAPAESWKIDLTADYFRQREESEPVIVYAGDFASPYTLVAFFNAFAPLLGRSPITSGDLGRLSDPYEVRHTGPSRDDFDIWGLAADAQLELGKELNLRSITSYRGFNGRIANDQDGTVVFAAEWLERTRQRQFSQEIKLDGSVGSAQFTTGLYLFDEKGLDDTLIPIASGLFAALEALPAAVIALAPIPVDASGSPLFTCPAAPMGFPCAGGAGNPLNITLDQTFRIFGDLRARSIAGYGQVEVQLFPWLAISAGGRLTHERKRFFAFQSKIESSVALGFNIYNLEPRRRSAKWTSFTPHLGVKWNISPDWMAYLSYDRGFRSGTFNGRANSEQTFSDVAPETLDAFELGAKGTLFNGKARVSLAAFRSIYSDVQFRAVIPSITGLDIFFINAARARIVGLEAEVHSAKIHGFSFGAALGLADAELTDVDPFVASRTGVRIGNRLPKTPRFNGSAYSQYDLLLGAGTLSFRLDADWRSAVWHDAANTLLAGVASTKEPGRVIIDGRVALASPLNSWEVTVWGKNLTNQDQFATLLANAGGLFNAYPLRGREIGVGLFVHL